MKDRVEPILLRSLIAYPDKANDFFKRIKISIFSDAFIPFVKIIKALNEEGRLALVFFEAEVHNHEALKSSEELIEIMAAIPLPLLDDLIEALFKKGSLRRQRKLAEQLKRASDEGIILDLDSLLDSSFHIAKIKTLKEWEEILTQGEDSAEAERLKTGLGFLDLAFEGGLEKGQLMLLSGDAESGKTTLGTQIIENFALTRKVCFFALEFQAKTYVNSPGAKRMGECKSNIFLEPYEDNIETILQIIRSLHSNEGVEYFLIDSQMRLEVNNLGKNVNVEERESYKFSKLAKLCHSLNILIILIIQTAKGQTESPLGTKKGEHEASIIVRLEKTRPRSKEQQMTTAFDEFRRRIIIKKNKQTGKHMEGIVAFNPKLRRLIDLTPATEQERDVKLDVDYRSIMGVDENGNMYSSSQNCEDGPEDIF